MTKSGLPLKYWEDAVQTIIYTQNLISSSWQPKLIPAEAWFGKCQDVSYLRPFGTTAYKHVLLDLNLSKLLPRSVKVSLLGYFGQEGYKLLDQKTGVVFKSRDIIFKESITHLAEQTMCTSFSENNNPFQYYSIQNIEIKDSESHRSEYQTQNNQTRGELLQQVAPRPLPTSMLYDDQENCTMQHATRETTN